MKCLYYLDEIVTAINNLTKIIDTNTKKSSIDIIVPFVLGIIGTVIGLLLGVLISNIQERKKFISSNHIEYLKYLNRLNFNINNILSDIVNIDKFGKILLKSNYQTFTFLPNNSYLDIALKIRTLKSYLTTNQAIYTSTETQARYYKEIIEASDRIFNTSIFIKTVGEFEYDAINYYYLIQKNFREKYDEIISKVTDATQNNMSNFDLDDFKGYLVEYIREINEYIQEINHLKKK